MDGSPNNPGLGCPDVISLEMETLIFRNPYRLNRRFFSWILDSDRWTACRRSISRKLFLRGTAAKTITIKRMMPISSNM
jgi:hypothetical protein